MTADLGVGALRCASLRAGRRAVVPGDAIYDQDEVRALCRRFPAPAEPFATA